MSDKCVMCQGETREVTDWTLCDSCNVATYISPGRPVDEEAE